MSTCSRSATSAALRSGRTLNPMTMAFDAEASSTSDSLMAPTPERMMLILTLSSESFVSVSASTSAEPCTSAFTIIGSSLTPPSAICSFRRLEGEAAALGAERLLLGPRLAEGGNLPRLRRVGHGLERVARLRQAREPEHLDWSGGPGGFHGSSAVVDERAHAADNGSGDEVVSDAQRAVLHEDGGHGTAAAIELGFEHGTGRRDGAGSPSARGCRSRAGSSRAAVPGSAASWRRREP